MKTIVIALTLLLAGCGGGQFGKRLTEPGGKCSAQCQAWLDRPHR